jgi:hypothetical protein
VFRSLIAAGIDANQTYSNFPDKAFLLSLNGFHHTQHVAAKYLVDVSL